MATVEYKVCDRCQEKISYHSRLLARVQMPKVFRIRWIITGISTDSQKELCGKCAEELEAFLEVKPKEEQNGR